jgi:hypothetical protein
MQRPLSQPAAAPRLRAHATNEERELALLTQFMRHDSVASLADAMAERMGLRGKDLIAAAGLGSNAATAGGGRGSRLTEAQDFAG